MCGHAPAARVTFTYQEGAPFSRRRYSLRSTLVSRLRPRRRSGAPGPDAAEGLLGPDLVRHQRRRGGRQRSFAPSHHATRAPGAGGRGAGAAGDAHAARRSGGAACGLLDAPARRRPPGLRRDRLRRARRGGSVARGVVGARGLPRRYRSVRPGALPRPPRRPPGGGRRSRRAAARRRAMPRWWRDGACCASVPPERPWSERPANPDTVCGPISPRIATGWRYRKRGDRQRCGDQVDAGELPCSRSRSSRHRRARSCSRRPPPARSR